MTALDRVIVLLLAAGRVADVRAVYEAARWRPSTLGPAIAALVHLEPPGALREAALLALDELDLDARGAA